MMKCSANYSPPPPPSPPPPSPLSPLDESEEELLDELQVYLYASTMHNHVIPE